MGVRARKRLMQAGGHWLFSFSVCALTCLPAMLDMYPYGDHRLFQALGALIPIRSISQEFNVVDNPERNGLGLLYFA